MSELEVRIVDLPPMEVVSFYAFSPSPELEAWQKLAEWAETHGLLGKPGSYRIFGFNNPNPSPGSPNYGYEFWLAPGPEAGLELDRQKMKDADLKSHPGGMYAVTRCQGAENITATWRELLAWCEESPYQHAHRQWVEEHIGPIVRELSPDELTLDLYMPIAK